jgi:hypothetical protein
MTVAGELSILKHNQEKGKGDASRISEKKEGNTLSINDMMGFISDKNPTKK